jgi:hypothetical protein
MCQIKIYGRRPVTEGKHMPQYILLLHEAPSDFSNFSPEEMQQVIGEYAAWKRKIEAEGKYAGGNKLKDEGGRHISMRNGKARAVDGPYAEAKEVMGGKRLIRSGNVITTIRSHPSVG